MEISPFAPTSRVLEAMRTKIRSGHWPPGKPIPTRKELADAFHVSLSVVDRALSRLREDGLLSAGKQGHSPLVLDPPAKPLPSFRELFERVEALEQEVERLKSRG